MQEEQHIASRDLGAGIHLARSSSARDENPRVPLRNGDSSIGASTIYYDQLATRVTELATRVTELATRVTELAVRLTANALQAAIDLVFFIKRWYDNREPHRR